MVRRSDAQTLRRSDAQTLRRSDSQTVRPLDSRTVRWSDGQTVRQSDGHGRMVGQWVWSRLLGAMAYLPCPLPFVLVSVFETCVPPSNYQFTPFHHVFFVTMNPCPPLHHFFFGGEGGGQHHHSSYISYVGISTTTPVTPFNRLFASLRSLLSMAKSFIVPMPRVENDDRQVRDVSYNGIGLPCGWSNLFVLK